MINQMTWDEFKRQVEAAGIANDDVISYIDWGGSAGAVITVEISERPEGRTFRIED